MTLNKCPERNRVTVQHTVNFLGEDIIFPEEAIQYVSYLNYFTSMQIRLTRYLYNFAKKDWTGLDEGLRKQINEEANRVIKLLTDQKIFNVTINDLRNKNVGYKRCDEVLKNGYKDCSQIMLKHFNALIAGYEATEAATYSKIRGTDTMLISSSMTCNLVYTAVECGLMSLQAQQAKAEFGKAINNLVDSNTAAEEKELKQYQKNVWFPKLSEALTIYVFEMMNTYLLNLEKAGIYHYSAVSNYDVVQSNHLLKNLRISTDKSPVLIEAFKACPYNPKVYTESLRLGLLDCTMYRVAETFKQSNNLKKKVLASFESVRKERNVFESYARNQKLFALVAYINGQDEESVVEAHFLQHITEIEEKYNRLKQAISSQGSFSEWLRELTKRKDIKKIISLGDTSLKEKISNAVRGIISVQDYEILIKHTTALRIEKITPENSSANDISEVNSIWIALLNEKLDAYLKEARRRLAACEDALEEYTSAKQQIQDQICKLQNDRAKVGLFSFSKKKMISEQIEMQKKALDSLERDTKVQSLQFEFEAWVFRRE